LENDQRAGMVAACIEETNRHIGKGYLNNKASDLFEQAQSWMPYLWFVPTAELEMVFDYAVQNRTNASSPLTLQNLLDAARTLINSNRIKPIRTNGVLADCQNCKGTGWESLEVWQPPRGAEFATPEARTVVDRCNCDQHIADKPDHTPIVSKLMRWLASAHPAGIPNVQMEQSAARRLAEFGYTLDDVASYLGEDELISLVSVVKGIGRWQLRRELSELKVGPQNEIAAIALKILATGGMTEAQIQTEKDHRRQFADDVHRKTLTCETCGVPRKNGRCEMCD
jgi:hypothetical protein